MTDPAAFELGRNIAVTPGKVVFQNDLVQLIQYNPTTVKVYQRPLLIVPPWINKYYILDLTPEKSFIRWAVERGYTVFVVSWVNPDTRLAGKTFADYMTEGVLGAVDAVTRIARVKDMNAIGYCIGGTLLAATLGYMAAKGDKRIRSATFFATQVDFSQPGDLQVFIDERQLANLDRLMEDKGYLEGQEMFTTFNMLRANDLFWSFYVNNYLLGKEPTPFDLLYWNADATRMPRQTHMFYLREMYLRNNLAKPGGIELAGVPVDLTKVNIPIYLLASREDHIAPYPSVFKACHLFSGPVRFVLAGSGHIAGVINPPSMGKYQYWVNGAQDGQVGELDDWLAGAKEHPGSWWPDWDKWLAPQSGPRVPARKPGAGKKKGAIIEDAPGSYVKMRS
jgi:polyhydroxyalkanoate synthase